MFRPYPVLPFQGSTFTSECRLSESERDATYGDGCRNTLTGCRIWQETVLAPHCDGWGCTPCFSPPTHGPEGELHSNQNDAAKVQTFFHIQAKNIKNCRSKRKKTHDIIYQSQKITSDYQRNNTLTIKKCCRLKNNAYFCSV